MPYDANDQLPDNVTARPKIIQDRWRAIFNSVFDATNSEEQAFASANAILEKGATLNLIPEKPPVRKANIAFVGYEPSELDAIRGTALVGNVGKVFNERYLEPLGVNRDNVYITTVFKAPISETPADNIEVPEDTAVGAIEKELADVNPRIVVALGWKTKAALGDLADFVLPHPAAIYKHADSGEVKRKVGRISKALEHTTSGRYYVDIDARNQDAVCLTLEGGKLAGTYRAEIPIPQETPRVDVAPQSTRAVSISKADARRQIVYGVVLAPYVVDLDGDVMTPDDIEVAAHDFMAGGATIGYWHDHPADAHVLESYIAPVDMSLGGQAITKGSWILVTKVNDPDIWAQIESGAIRSYSIGGTGKRTPLEL